MTGVKGNLGLSRDSQRYYERYSFCSIVHRQHCPVTYTYITCTTRQSEMANTSPRHMPVLGNVHPIKIENRDVISLLARVFILLIDTATQEVPMENIWKICQSSFWATPLNCYMLNVAQVTHDVKWRPIVTTFGTLTENMSRTGLYDCHILEISFDDCMSNINSGIGVLHVKRQILTYIFVTSFPCSLKLLLLHLIGHTKRCLPKKWLSLYRSCGLDLCPMKVIFFS